jgi:HK97 family phage major capsid protein
MDFEQYQKDLTQKLDTLALSINEKLTEGQKSYVDTEGKVKSLEDMLTEVNTKISDMDEAMTKRSWANEPGLEDEKQKFSIFKAFNAISSRNWEGADFEKDVMHQAKTKAQAAGVDTAGGFLVPLQALGGFIEILRANMVTATLGATILNDLTGIPVEVPRQTSSTLAHWVEENSALTESEIGLGMLQMNPKALGSLVKMSNRSVRLTQPAIEQLVQRDIAEQMARRLDITALRGSGVLGEPLGIVNQVGVVTVDFDSTAVTGAATNPSWEGMYELEGVLEDADALKGNLGYAFAPAIKRQMSKLRAAAFATVDNEGDFLQTAPMTSANITAVLGHKFATTTQMPTNLGSSTDQGEVIFGNWADLLIGMWGGMRLKASEDASTAFERDQLWVRAIMDVDVAIRRVESFTVGIEVNKVVDVSGA